HTTIQMGHFASETVIKDDITLSTDIVTEVEEVMDFVRKHINKEVIITEQPENIERWQYPLEGIRELVVNMIVHRDYMSGLHSTIKIFPDSIVFYNSGTLPAHITIDRKSTRLNSSHVKISYAVFCLKKKRTIKQIKTK